jgi:solute carrier family 25 carnitine/acylcarnitine transporter 20/29
MTQSAIKLFKTEGLVGFYRGAVPPLLGSSIFRATQFAVFEAIYTKLDNHSIFSNKIPFTFGLEPRIILGGFAAGTARSIIECPFEYSKVQGQTGQTWHINTMYQGFKPLWLRNTSLLVIYFNLIDFFRRNTNAYNYKYSLFFMNGFCASIGFLLIWPVEIAKNRIQSMKSEESKLVSIKQIIRKRVNEHGVIQGLYRGCVAGLLSVFIRNGASILAMLYGHRLLTSYGFRD